MENNFSMMDRWVFQRGSASIMYINYGKKFEDKFENSIPIIWREWQIIILTITYNLM